MTRDLNTENLEAIKNALDKPIILAGMMGTGKSAVGKVLAEQLDIPFYDSDHEIETRAGLSINDIFELYGEEKFRETEHKTISELLENKRCIIATGGGTLTTPETLTAIKSSALSIWLQTDVDTLMKRLEHAKNRPLLKQDNPKAVLQDLLEKRKNLYAQMDLHIQTHENNIDETVRRISEAIGSALVDETP